MTRSLSAAAAAFAIGLGLTAAGPDSALAVSVAR
jgi:hypothetical protein